MGYFFYGALHSRHVHVANVLGWEHGSARSAEVEPGGRIKQTTRFSTLASASSRLVRPLQESLIEVHGCHDPRPLARGRAGEQSLTFSTSCA
eukprot:7351779-Pyramimonas_sp.AAC.1